MSILLAIDVGNTQITVGSFRGKDLLHTWRLKTDRYATSDELGLWFLQLLRANDLAPANILGIVIASVVPNLDPILHQAMDVYLEHEPLMVGPNVDLGIRNLYKNPEEVGADRLVNAVAVHAVVDSAAIVVDFGTATTFDCVSAKGEYLGGVICPGLEIATEALVQKTSKLPRITFNVPAHAMGRTTVESLQSGLFWGYIGLVEGIIKRLADEMGTHPKIVATGGLSPVIGPRIHPTARILPNLTLDGLRLIWERNQPK